MKKQFAQDVLKGLKSCPKYLSSKYFYDEKGDKLFQKIMALPEYYLTRAEYSIFKQHKKELLRQFSSDSDGAFDLIELGAGDGTKTKILLEKFLKNNADFTYFPIDISAHVLKELTDSLNQAFPSLKVSAIQKEYFEAIKEINSRDRDRKKVVLFLGSNIGNFDEDSAGSFLNGISGTMEQGDLLLIGFDLKKDPKIIKKAYDDEAGITKAFNINLLQRINKELNADFELKKFMHYAVYNPEDGKASSYLISKENQKVKVGDELITFASWETIHVEISQKFDQRMIGELAEKTGFEIVGSFYDEKKYFTDSLWRKR